MYRCMECGIFMNTDAEQNVTVCKGGFCHINCPSSEWIKEQLIQLQKDINYYSITQSAKASLEYVPE